MKKLFKEKMSEEIYTKSKKRRYRQPFRLLRLGFSIILLSLVFIQGSCKKEDCDNPRNPECSNYDACIDAVETNADFGFYTEYVSASYGTIYIPLRDTLYTISNNSPGRIWFRAQSSQMDKYEWTIGSDSRTFVDSVFDLNFVNLPPNYHLKAKLKVYNKNSSSSCFPSDLGIAEVEKTLVTKIVYNGSTPDSEKEIDSLKNQYFPIYGEFFGNYEDDQQDTCTISITSKWPLASVLSSCTNDLPYSCLGQIDFITQNGFIRKSHALECAGSYLSIGILDNEDKDRLIIKITDRNSPDNNLRTWVGRRVK